MKKEIKKQPVKKKRQVGKIIEKTVVIVLILALVITGLASLLFI